MKFYRYPPANKQKIIPFDQSNLIYQNDLKQISFLRNNRYHNVKNAAFLTKSGCKEYYLDGKCYGNQEKLTKESWRRFVKLQLFL